MSPEVKLDVLRTEAAENEGKETFICDRFINGSSEDRFFEPIKKLKLKTMDKMIKLASSQGKIIQYREQSDLAFMLLVKSQLLDLPLNLDELMRYSLTPVPNSLGTADVFFQQNKQGSNASLLDGGPSWRHFVSSGCFLHTGRNALFYTLANLPPNFGAICLQVLDQIVAKKNFIFSMDSYHEDSIKSQERLRHCFSQHFVVGGLPQKSRLTGSCSWLMRRISYNCGLLLRVLGSWSAASSPDRSGTAVVVVEGNAYQLDSTDRDVSTWFNFFSIQLINWLSK